MFHGDQSSHYERGQTPSKVGRKHVTKTHCVVITPVD